MKLIDILVEELHKRGWWPDGAVECYWHRGFDVAHFYDSLRNEVPNPIYIRGASLCGGDSYGVVITREQYEAALAAKNDGLIEWGGGKIPVDNVTVVDIKFRSGVITSGVESGVYYWPRTGRESDIIAYRMHRPQKAEQAKADEETDLNECASQDAAPVWNGEGLPPVGCMCEISCAGDEWQSCKILFASNQLVFVKMKESGIEDAYSIGYVTFRPLRTEAERNRDAAVEQMMKFATIHTAKSLGLDLALRSCYDAIAAGKIPGLKLED